MVLVILMAGVFGLYAIGEGDFGLFSADRATSQFFSSQAPLSNTAIFSHMWLGGVVTILVPLQAIGWLRSKLPALHRALGYLIAALAFATAMGGLAYIVLRGTQGGWPMSLAFAAYGLLMLAAAVQTLRHARAGWVTHRDWALRLVVLILGSWLYRVHYGLWYMATGGLASNEAFTGAFDLINLVAFYLPYLIALELWLRVRPSARPEPSAPA